MFTHFANCKLQIILKFTINIEKQNRMIHRENFGLKLIDGLNQFSDDIRQTGTNVSFPTYLNVRQALELLYCSSFCITLKWWWAGVRSDYKSVKLHNMPTFR